ncbi:MAG: hypothetical protein U0903_20320 [Planctomycetales bacterium]
MDGALEGEQVQEAEVLAMSQADPNLHPDSFRRIQACLIACEGISTEDLERGIIHEMRQTLRDLVPILQGMRRNCA